MANKDNKVLRVIPHVYPLAIRWAVYRFVIWGALKDVDRYGIVITVMFAIAILDAWQHYSKSLTITDEFISYKYGMLWRQEEQLRLEEWKKVTSRRGLFDFFFGTATLVFSVSGGEGIRMKYVWRYKSVKKKVRELRKKARDAA